MLRKIGFDGCDRVAAILIRRLADESAAGHTR
jgi:hypothetical protein